MGEVSRLLRWKVVPWKAIIASENTGWGNFDASNAVVFLCLIIATTSAFPIHDGLLTRSAPEMTVVITGSMGAGKSHFFVGECDLVGR